jgi:hypothetical protein
MKSGIREINEDIKIKSINGEERQFKKGDKITVQSLHRKQGICQITDNPEIYKCKTIRGISKLEDD